MPVPLKRVRVCTWLSYSSYTTPSTGQELPCFPSLRSFTVLVRNGISFAPPMSGMRQPVGLASQSADLTKMENDHLRTLCKELATQPSRARRAHAAARLRQVLAEEKERVFTPASSSILRIAGQVFHFLEEFQQEDFEAKGRPRPARKQGNSIRPATRIARASSKLGLASANLAD